MAAEVVAVHGVPRVADDHLTTLAVRQTPVDDVLAQRTTRSTNVSVSVTIGRQESSVEDDDLSGIPDHLRLLTIEPGHFILFSLESSWMAIHKT